MKLILKTFLLIVDLEQDIFQYSLVCFSAPLLQVKIIQSSLESKAF